MTRGLVTDYAGFSRIYCCKLIFYITKYRLQVVAVEIWISPYPLFAPSTPSPDRSFTSSSHSTRLIKISIPWNAFLSRDIYPKIRKIYQKSLVGKYLSPGIFPSSFPSDIAEVGKRWVLKLCFSILTSLLLIDLMTHELVTKKKIKFDPLLKMVRHLCTSI